jgi:hypothetical protein
LEESEKSKKTLLMRNALLERSKKVARRVNDVNRDLSGQLEKIEQVLGLAPLDDERPAFRTLIITAILARRWCLTVGSPAEYNQDERNWWWICKEKRELGIERILDRLYELNELQNRLNRDVKELVKQDSELRNEIASLSETLMNFNHEDAVKTQRIIDLERLVVEIRDERVEIGEYQLICRSEANVRQELKDTQRIVEGQVERIADLERNLGESVALCEEKHLIIRGLEQIQMELRDRSEELEIAYQELRERTREVCALERILRSEREMATLNRYRLESVVRELRNRGGEIVGFRELESEKENRDLSRRFDELGQSLLGTRQD